MCVCNGGDEGVCVWVLRGAEGVCVWVCVEGGGGVWVCVGVCNGGGLRGCGCV